jgi:uncharacterized membrane protein
MKEIWQTLQEKNRGQIILTLFISSWFSTFILGFRIYYSGYITYLFLIWNLFLAWIPYLITLFLVIYGQKISSKLVIGFLIITWLLFFPNSPYIITDLFHFNKRPHIPLWFDLVLIYSFAWNGIILGFLSLIDMHNFIRKNANEWIGWLFVFSSLFLGSFGIYLGRYERFNSWDVVTNPFGLLSDILEKFSHPFSPATLTAISITILFSGFLMVAYFTLRAMSVAVVEARKNS